MAVTINADNGVSSGSAGLKQTADSTGVLVLQTNGTTAVTVDTNQNTTLAGYLSAPNTFGFKNRIINGAMGIWQRSTSGAITTSPTYVAADRWGVDQATSAAATFSQSTSVPTAVAQYSGKVQRNNASTGTNNIVLAQAFETANSYDLAGQSATLSFYAKAGVNFSATSNQLNYNVFYGQGTDQSLVLMRSNAWTGITNSSSNALLTTTWTRYTFTVSVPAGTTQVGLQFFFTPTGTAGADDAFYITGVQLEKGSTATTFDYRPYGTEISLCQRYYSEVGKQLVGRTESAALATMSTSTAVKMRVAPTASIITTGSAVAIPGIASYTLSSISAQSATDNAVYISLNTSGGMSVGTVILGAVDRVLGLNSEL